MDQRGSSSLIETAGAATCLDQSFNITSAYTVTYSIHLLSSSYTINSRKYSEYGRRPTSAAATGGAFFHDSATKQITDIEVGQAETSLQKASGGFSFFGSKQDKCTK
jgi:hypothetical protein